MLLKDSYDRVTLRFYFFLFLFLDHFFNKEWSILPTSGYPVRGGFGHSSVWDDITNRIYVYGGYVSTGTIFQEFIYSTSTGCSVYILSNVNGCSTETMHF